MNTLRKICPRRARKLRRRGEEVWWNDMYGSHVWRMRWKYLNRWKGDTAKRNVLYREKPNDHI